MKELLKKVEEFNKAYKIDYAKKFTLISPDEYTLKYNLMFEENSEYLDACGESDSIEVADALGDQLYILLGTILKHGLQDKIVEIFYEIHDSNMSKLDENDEPILREDGKVLKGKNYFKPDLKKILYK